MPNNSGVYNPPREHPMMVMDATFEPDVMKQVIGRDGCYFKQITEQTGVSYIWHQRDTNKVEIWGPQNLLQLAVSSIQYRLYTVILKMVQNNQSVSQNSINWMNGYHNWYQSYIQNMNYMHQSGNMNQSGNMIQPGNMVGGVTPEQGQGYQGY